jgi:hypothetical protein
MDVAPCLICSWSTDGKTEGSGQYGRLDGAVQCMGAREMHMTTTP